MNIVLVIGWFVALGISASILFNNSFDYPQRRFFMRIGVILFWIVLTIIVNGFLGFY